LDDVDINQSGGSDDLIIVVKSTGAVIRAPYTFYNGNAPYDGIENILFADGTELSGRTAIQAAFTALPPLVVAAAPGASSITAPDGNTAIYDAPGVSEITIW
jgi:hypothetical protein